MSVAHVQIAGINPQKYKVPELIGLPNLHEHGVAVVELIKSTMIPKVGRIFEETETQFPEYQPETVPYVLGGFAAYGNPSSFHNNFVKAIRRKAKQNIVESGIFSEFLESSGLNPDEYRLEVLFDRMMHRHAQQKPDAETAHRDVTPRDALEDGDFVFGGWVNLSEHTQYLVCKPGSHRDVKNTRAAAELGEGFNKLTKEEAAISYAPSRRRIPVPPGHLIVFLQHIVHEVFNVSTTHEQLRLFIGWRLTRSNNLLFAEQKATAIYTAGVPLLPSGQVPPMYSANHASVFKNKPFKLRAGNEQDSLVGWLNKAFVPAVKTTFNRNGVMDKRAMQSLQTYGLLESPNDYEYKDEDRDLMLTLHDISTGKVNDRKKSKK